MRFLSALLTCISLLAATAALADSRVFIISNQADSYGVDQCLAKGEKCGAHAARSYCQSRDFAQAVSYRRVDPDEITGSIPKVAGQLQPCRLQRIRRHYLPALTPFRRRPSSSATPAPRKRRDAAPRSGYVGPRRPRFLACYHGWIWLKR